MTKAACRSSFLFKAFQKDLGAAGDGILQDFDGNLSTERFLFGQIHVSHAATSQASQQKKLSNLKIAEVCGRLF
jgi:hypothetical protein